MIFYKTELSERLIMFGIDLKLLVYEEEKLVAEEFRVEKYKKV